MNKKDESTISINILEERKNSILNKSDLGMCSGGIRCDSNSLSGAISQRACVYCGARVVLNPITDAYHIVHGPIGCASYTWDIRGSLSSGEDIYRNSFSTDLREKDIIFGGIDKLRSGIEELMIKQNPKLIFVYATCIVGVIGDDVEALCREMSNKYDILVIPVKSPGFSGNKATGYKMACDAIMQILNSTKNNKKTKGINILGDFNLAGEMWIIKDYMKKIGINVISAFTGDASLESLKKAPQATLNVVQCAGSSVYLANRMEEEMGIPFIKVSFFGIEDTTASLIRIASALKDEEAIKKAKILCEIETKKVMPIIDKYKKLLKDKTAAIYVGGGFKAISLIREFNNLGIRSLVIGTQTGRKDEYELIESLADKDAVILDDANPAELEKYMLEKNVDILVGGVKERPLAYKLGIAFCDHNHERKSPLAGFVGAVNFVKEINDSINSPVWEFVRDKK